MKKKEALILIPGFFTWTSLISTTYSLKKTGKTAALLGDIVNEALEKKISLCALITWGLTYLRVLFLI